jgi:predicted CxxxxCH...CXXCH cytochrome family protein
MHRASSLGAAAAALALAACGSARVAQTPLAGDSVCASCHTAPGQGPPFRDTSGSIDPGRVTVGAHNAHLQPVFTSPISCGECHQVPQGVNDPGHLDAVPPNDVQFGTLARTGGASPVYHQGDGCAASYCHGNFPGGTRTNTPPWVGGAGAAQCGSCHGIPPPSGRHPEHLTAGVSCDRCHGSFLETTHVNGTVDVPLPVYNRQFKTCAAACHDPRSWPAPGDAGL